MDRVFKFMSWIALIGPFFVGMLRLVGDDREGARDDFIMCIALYCVLTYGDRAQGGPDAR